MHLFAASAAHRDESSRLTCTLLETEAVVTSEIKTKPHAEGKSLHEEGHASAQVGGGESSEKGSSIPDGHTQQVYMTCDVNRRTGTDNRHGHTPNRGIQMTHIQFVHVVTIQW